MWKPFGDAGCYVPKFYEEIGHKKIFELFDLDNDGGVTFEEI